MGSLLTSGPFDGLDEASANLIIQLQLDDLRNLDHIERGKGGDGRGSDLKVAIDLQEQDFQRFQNDARDRRMAESIAQAVQEDATLLAGLIVEERGARTDRQLALRLSDRTEPDNRALIRQPESINADLDNGTLARLAGKYVSDQIGQKLLPATDHTQENGLDAGAASADGSGFVDNAVGFHEKALKFLVQCVICGERKRYYDAVKVSCGHDYCIDCLKDLFNSAMRDETLFPPRCCKEPIEINDFAVFLPRHLKENFEEKRIEFGTQDRTYCSEGYCAVFIPSANVSQNLATCPKCGIRTCAKCKEGAHSGDCPKDFGIEQMKMLAREQGWQQCFKCKRLVELDTGCNHITCRCKAQFCYVCGERWKTCRCAQWHEHRLYARGTILAEREIRAFDPNNPDHHQQVENAVEMLREQHECDHDTWIRRSQADRCEECHEDMPLFIMECLQCRIRACRRCSLNRL